MGVIPAVADSFGVELGNYNELAGISVGDLAKKVDTLANYPAEESCLSIVLALPIILLLTPFARAIPPDRETAGGLARAILARNYGAFADKHGSAGERGIITAIRSTSAWN